MNNEFHIIVQKYGGSSVADPEKIKTVAQFIRSQIEPDRRILVVVSAMGHTTNQLIALANQVSSQPKKRELDMLISCGERSSMALLAMALNDIGVKALSLTGSQSGIITDDNHNGAEIIAIKPSRVFQAFSSYQVVIVAGFQGISEKKEITTLRRGGSDTTAVALAAALKALYCEIYTDVPGVMDIDPKIVPLAKLLPSISLDQMESMALYGARVMAHDAIKIANEFGVSLLVKKACDPEGGTKIEKGLTAVADENAVIAITHLRAVLRIALPLESLPSVVNDAGYFLCGAMRGDQFIGYTSNDLSQELLASRNVTIGPGLALITVHLKKNQFALSVLKEISSFLKRLKTKSNDLIVGRNEIFIVVDDESLNETLTVFHAGLLMEEKTS